MIRLVKRYAPMNVCEFILYRSDYHFYFYNPQGLSTRINISHPSIEIIILPHRAERATIAARYNGILRNFVEALAADLRPRAVSRGKI